MVAKTNRKTNRKQSAIGWLLSFFGFVWVDPGQIPKPKTKQLNISLLSKKKILIIKGYKIAQRRRQFRIPLSQSTTLAFKLNKPAGRPKKPKLLRLSLPGQKRIFVRANLVSAVMLLLIGSGGLIFFGWQVINPPLRTGTFHPPVIKLEPLKQPQKQTPNLPRSLPKSLHVEAIGINASFVEIGRLADDSLEVPSSFDAVGWYKDSPTPGEIGPAVVVGHLDSPKNIAVFWRLHELQPGQIIEVARADNSIAKFRVDEVSQFSQDSFPTERVYGAIDYAGLRLITCGGQFNKATQNYSHNTVVFASMLP